VGGNAAIDHMQQTMVYSIGQGNKMITTNPVIKAALNTIRAEICTAQEERIYRYKCSNNFGGSRLEYSDEDEARHIRTELITLQFILEELHTLKCRHDKVKPGESLGFYTNIDQWNHDYTEITHVKLHIERVYDEAHARKVELNKKAGNL